VNAHFSTPTTYEDRLKARARAARQACYGKPKIVNVAKVRPTGTEQQSYASPFSFVRSKCSEHGITYEALVARDQTDKFYAIRKAVIEAAHQRYPEMSAEKLGKLIKRHRSTIHSLLGRRVRRNPTAEEIVERDRLAEEMYRAGAPLETISVEIGISISTIKAIRKRAGWDNRGRIKKRTAAEVRGE
jgi:hypothetical protein